MTIKIIHAATLKCKLNDSIVDLVDANEFIFAPDVNFAINWLCTLTL